MSVLLFQALQLALQWQLQINEIWCLFMITYFMRRLPYLGSMSIQFVLHLSSNNPTLGKCPAFAWRALPLQLK